MLIDQDNTDEFMKIQCSMFTVNDIPYCVWDPYLQKSNLEFINSINHRYFEYLAKIHAVNLDGDDKHLAATALRLAFYHGLETFFTLIFAALQAPECVLGWVHRYQIGQLRAMVKSVNKGNARFIVKPRLQPLSWDTISDHINLFSYEEKERTIQTKKLFAELWKRFGSDFLEDYNIQEYNSIKHGLRVSPGGFALAIGLEKTYGVSPPPEEMQLLGSSDFGNSFFRVEPISNTKDDPNFRIKKSAVNWNPEAIIYSLHLISISINNIASFLKLVNGVDPKNVEFIRPQDSEDFDKPIEGSPGLQNMTLNIGMDENVIRKFSRKEITNELHRRFGS